ncbi:hypothetical protein GGI21_003734 [Coemansia aciculifera]|nr:hypothetical protein GGI21_003734 [Coemansia aciculifera]
MPVSYVTIYERDAPEMVLYVSSNMRAVLGYEVSEMVGRSILDFSCDSYAKHYSCQWPADNPELGVTMLPHNLRHKDGHKVFTHVTSINCTGHMFSIVTGFPELGTVEVNESVLYKLQHEVQFGQEMMPPMPITKESLQKASIYTARACRAKACFVLNIRDSPTTASDVVIEFVTNSISSIFNGATDGYEIIGCPFFSLVAPADITKAAAYMDALRNVAAGPQLCTLHLLCCPPGSSISDNSNRLVKVELFGAVSDNKVVLLCQKVRSQKDADDQLPYMSLEEIISSDPDSTDIGDQWNGLVL